MKKLSIGLFVILTFTSMVNADGFSEADRELIGAKDFPFPPGQESSLPEEGKAPPQDWSQTYDNSDMTPQTNSSTYSDSRDPSPVPPSGKSNSSTYSDPLNP